MSGKVLIIDDEKNITLVVQAMLERAGFQAFVLNDSTLTQEFLVKESVDAIVTDLYMPGLGGMEIVEYTRKMHPEVPVVVITAYGTIESAVNALKGGAFDFITKPFDQTDLLNAVEKAVATHHQRLKEPVFIFNPVSKSSAQIEENPALMSSMIGTSPIMQDIFKMISKIAQSPATVLIWGESGTGKELVAYEIHRHSDRANKPFIKINCAAIPGTLIESELFGFEKGAFTGAVAAKPGRFELAHDGTLFLDEVAEMSLEMQVKLLRVLQEHEFERVGGLTTIQVNVRIITASNKDLETEVKAGRFREDLFYRLNVVPIRLPALRDRREDIELLVRYFIAQFNQKLKKEVSGFTPEAFSALRNHPWPGNIRQLENVIERMVLMSESTVLGAEDLPEEFVGWIKQTTEVKSDSSNLKRIVRKQTQSLERNLIEKALGETRSNVTRAAKKLGLSRKGLQLKMKELGLRKEL